MLCIYGLDEFLDRFIHAAEIRKRFFVGNIRTEAYPKRKILLIEQYESLIGALRERFQIAEQSELVLVRISGIWTEDRTIAAFVAHIIDMQDLGLVKSRYFYFHICTVGTDIYTVFADLITAEARRTTR